MSLFADRSNIARSRQLALNVSHFILCIGIADGKLNKEVHEGIEPLVRSHVEAIGSAGYRWLGTV